MLDCDQEIGIQFLAHTHRMQAVSDGKEVKGVFRCPGANVCIGLAR